MVHTLIKSNLVWIVRKVHDLAMNCPSSYLISRILTVCGYSTEWKFSNFPAILALHKINFSWFSGGQEILFEQFWRLCILMYGKIWHLKMSKISKHSKFLSAQMVIMAVFWALNDQNLFHAQSEWQKNPEISTLCIPN